MTEQEFLTMCIQVLNFSMGIFMALWDHWYFRLLIAAGLVWLGLDIFEEISNIYFEDRDNFKRY